MKLQFRLNNNRLMCDNTSVLSQYIISESDFIKMKMYAKCTGIPSVIDVCSDKAVFICIPDTECNDGSYTLDAVFVVRKNNGTFVVTNDKLELNFEDGDVAFTNIAEAVAFCDEFNEHLALKHAIEKRAKFLTVLNDMICDEIESLNSQYESEFGEHLDLSYDDVDDSFTESE